MEDRMRVATTVGVLALLLGSASAHAECAGFIGSIVEPQDIDELFAPFVEVGQKGEFETTASYQARLRSAIDSLTSPLVIEKVPEGREYLVYDADTATLHVVSYAFDNTGLNSDALFGYGAPYEGAFPHATVNHEVTIEEDEEVTDTYRASNSYGAETEVAQIYRRTRGIFQGPASVRAMSLFPSADERPYYAGSISLSPETARVVVPSLRLAFVVEPAAPYYLSAIYEYPSRPTVANPREVTNEVSALIGDIQCGLVLTEAGEVLGAFETR